MESKKSSIRSASSADVSTSSLEVHQCPAASLTSTRAASPSTSASAAAAGMTSRSLAAHRSRIPPPLDAHRVPPTHGAFYFSGRSEEHHAAVAGARTWIAQAVTCGSEKLVPAFREEEEVPSAPVMLQPSPEDAAVAAAAAVA
eukprot:CAMPEP_0181369824 /NCGR_PEP_ID=MMETSP1106-20121128/13028_1 /TAXON_ID=81844 /ORGANISM="Mantoniella antarctica, Strain SL-175" /LENGTH=142 /DNA_ID=CAMNT_0023486435 /DNA_START=545 /DNA_END=970 /DNA_ORIENTATION=-